MTKICSYSVLAAIGAAATLSTPASADFLFDDFTTGTFSLFSPILPDPQYDTQAIALPGDASVIRTAELHGSGSIGCDGTSLSLGATAGTVGYFESLVGGVPASGMGTLSESDVNPLSPLLDLSAEGKIEIDYSAPSVTLVTIGVRFWDATLSASDHVLSDGLLIDAPGTYEVDLASLFSSVDPSMIGGAEFTFSSSGTLFVTRIEAKPGTAIGPGGDVCAEADPIAGSGTFSFDSTFATTSGVNPTECGAVDDIFNDVWYAWTADETGEALLSLCGPGNDDDSMMVVWKAGEGCPPLRQIACDNDGCFVFGPSHRVIGVVSGETYLIQLGSAGVINGFTGQLLIDITPSQTGDFCDFAVPFAGEGTHDFDNTAYLRNNQYTPCTNPSNTLHGDYWVRWTADATGMATVFNCGVFTGINTVLTAWDASLGCPPVTSLGCNDNGCGLRSSISFPVVSGSDYLIQVGHVFGTDRGPETLFFDIAGPPANDDCPDAEPIVGTGTFPFETSLATLDAAGSTCGAPDRNVWFDWTAPSTGSFAIDTCGSGLDTRLAVWSGSTCPPTVELACNDDSCGTASRVTISATSGTHYLIEVLGAEGIGDLNVTRVDTACAVRPSSSGCVPEIDFAGSPTLAGSDNLTLLGTQIPGQTTGLLLWGLSRTPPASGGGTFAAGFTLPGAPRCIFAPRSTAPQRTGGSVGSCDGTLAHTLDQETMSLGGVLSGGTLVVQWVFNDVGLAGGLGSTAALEFTVQ